MKLTPDVFVYDLSDDLEPGWQTMEVLRQWTKEVTTKDPSGNTATYFVAEFGSIENDEAETIEWSGPLRQKGTRSKMGKLMKALFPDQHSVKSLNDLVGKRCEVNLQENEKGFLQVVEMRPEEHTKTKRRSTK